MEEKTPPWPFSETSTCEEDESRSEAEALISFLTKVTGNRTVEQGNKGLEYECFGNVKFGDREDEVNKWRDCDMVLENLKLSGDGKYSSGGYRKCGASPRLYVYGERERGGRI